MTKKNDFDKAIESINFVRWKLALFTVSGSEPVEQVGVEIRGMEFIVEPTQAGQDLFGQFRLEAAVEGTTEEDSTACGSELTQGAVVVDLKGAATLGE